MEQPSILKQKRSGGVTVRTMLTQPGTHSNASAGFTILRLEDGGDFLEEGFDREGLVKDTVDFALLK